MFLRCCAFFNFEGVPLRESSPEMSLPWPTAAGQATQAFYFHPPSSFPPYSSIFILVYQQQPLHSFTPSPAQPIHGLLPPFTSVHAIHLSCILWLRGYSLFLMACLIGLCTILRFPLLLLSSQLLRKKIYMNVPIHSNWNTRASDPSIHPHRVGTKRGRETAFAKQRTTKRKRRPTLQIEQRASQRHILFRKR